MLRVYFTKKFTKQYKLLSKRNSKIAKKLEKRIEIFVKNPRDPILKTHGLSGQLKGKYAFWINWNLRVVFQWIDKNSVRFIALETHS